MNFDKLKSILKERKISIARLEREAGIGNGTIATWNNRSPKVDTLKKAADYLGVKVDDLL